MPLPLIFTFALFPYPVFGDAIVCSPHVGRTEQHCSHPVPSGHAQSVLVLAPTGQRALCSSFLAPPLIDVLNICVGRLLEPSLASVGVQHA